MPFRAAPLPIGGPSGSQSSLGFLCAALGHFWPCSLCYLIDPPNLSVKWRLYIFHDLVFLSFLIAAKSALIWFTLPAILAGNCTPQLNEAVQVFLSGLSVDPPLLKKCVPACFDLKEDRAALPPFLKSKMAHQLPDQVDQLVCILKGIEPFRSVGRGPRVVVGSPDHPYNQKKRGLADAIRRARQQHRGQVYNMPVHVWGYGAAFAGYSIARCSCSRKLRADQLVNNNKVTDYGLFTTVVWCALRNRLLTSCRYQGLLVPSEPRGAVQSETSKNNGVMSPYLR